MWWGGGAPQAPLRSGRIQPRRRASKIHCDRGKPVKKTLHAKGPPKEGLPRGEALIPGDRNEKGGSRKKKDDRQSVFFLRD